MNDWHSNSYESMWDFYTGNASLCGRPGLWQGRVRRMVSALQTQGLLNPGFSKAIGNSLHFPVRGAAPRREFPKPRSGQTWDSGVLKVVLYFFMFTVALILMESSVPQRDNRGIL